MRLLRVCAVLLGMVVVLAACGRVPPSSGATGTQSPAESPTAAPTPLTIPGPTFHIGEVGLVYTPVRYQATGGNAPYVWRVSDGALPGGLDISADGAISGTPTTSGAFNFTVEVTDASLATTNVSGSISIVQRLTIATPKLPSVEQEIPYSAALVASGGIPPLAWRVYGGALPQDIQLSNNGVIAGTSPSNQGGEGTFSFIVGVTDAAHVTATFNGTITVVAHVWEFPGSDSPRGKTTVFMNYLNSMCPAEWDGFGYAQMGGGVPPYKVVIRPNSGNPPPGTTVKPLYVKLGNWFLGLVITDPSRLYAALPVGSVNSYLFGVEVTDALGATADANWMYNLGIGNDPSCPVATTSSPSPTPTP